ncbi:MAG: transcription antitermination factor NusB [Clostridia bacterium]|nr:transcription antitermination factor NusB [Clostridia bacterium]
MDTSAEREQAFILTFEKAFNPEMDADTIYEYAVSNEVIKESNFTRALFEEVCNKMPAIDGFIEEHSKSRALGRISKVSLSVLRLAVCEIRYFENTPVGVSINEAVELTKKYGSEDEYAFVNGILGAFAKGISE